MAKAKKAKTRDSEPKPDRELTKERLAAIEAGREAQVPFGKRLCALRKQHDLTQAALGDRTGLSQKYISQLECGHKSPSWETLVSLAKLGFAISMSTLLMGIEEPPDGELHRLEELFAGQPKPAQADLLRAIQLLLRVGGSVDDVNHP